MQRRVVLSVGRVASKLRAPELHGYRESEPGTATLTSMEALEAIAMLSQTLLRSARNRCPSRPTFVETTSAEGWR